MGRLNNLYESMYFYYRGMPEYIQHFVKVHSFAKMIATLEHVDEKTLYIIEAAALVHDIGIKPALEKYQSSAGKYQEELGPEEARKMMKNLGFDQDVIERVAFLVGNHHTYDNIRSIDHQILVEADFLVNYYENNLETETIRKSVFKIFKTENGRRMAIEMYFPEMLSMTDTWAADNIQALDDFIESQGIYLRQ